MRRSWKPEEHLWYDMHCTKSFAHERHHINTAAEGGYPQYLCDPVSSFLREDFFIQKLNYIVKCFGLKDDEPYIGRTMPYVCCTYQGEDLENDWFGTTHKFNHSLL